MLPKQRNVGLMTFDQQMERFWRAFTENQRRFVESDWRYQDALQELNPIKAQELAFTYLCQGDRARREFIAGMLQQANALCPD